MSHHYFRQTITDTTDHTPLIRQEGKRNSKRAQQISHLHQQFEDLKEKIREVQNKNQKIIQKIHKAYNFKKKSAYTEEYAGETTPVIHFEENKMYGYTGSASIDGKSNKSDYGEFDIKMQKRISQAPRKINKNQKFNHSVEYGRNEHPQEQVFNIKNQRQNYNRSLHQMSVPPLSHQAPQTVYSAQSLQKKVATLDEALNIERCRVLEMDEQLEEKDKQINRLKNIEAKLKNYSKTVKNMIEGSLEQFMQNVVQRNFLQLEKGIKKNDVKLKNMKNVAMVLKDKQEQRKSNRLIEFGRKRRSKSRSRRNSPPNVKQPSRSRSKINEQSQKNKEFQEIAGRYEELIKQKTQQIEKWDRKYRIKERECHQLKMRADILQKKLTEDDRKSIKNDSMSQDEMGGLIKRLNGERMLMEGEIEAEMEQKIKEKDEKIKELNKKIGTLENKVKMIHNEYKDSLQKTKEKVMEDYEVKIKQFQINLSEKNNEVLSMKSKLADAEKKLLERDCDSFGAENKLKKLQGLLETKQKKISQLEQLMSELNQGEAFERSMCIEGSSNTADMKSMRQYLQKLEDQLEEKKNEVFVLMKNKTLYMKRTDEVEEINHNLVKQMESMKIENEELKIKVNLHSSGQDSNEIDILDLDEEKLDQNEKILELQKEKEDLEEKYQTIKSTLMQKQNQYIKETGQLEYVRKALSTLEEKYNKIKEDHDFHKEDAEKLREKLTQTERELEFQRKENQQKINQIQQQWVEFQEEMKGGANKDVSDLRSEKSSIFNYKTKYDTLTTQNEYLTVKLKEVQTELKMQKGMEEKILNEYKNNMEKSKLDYRAKADENKALEDEVEMLRKKVGNLNLKISVDEKKKNQGKVEQSNQMMDKIQQLQMELKDTREINNRLTEMEGQLFKEMKINEEQKVQLLQQLQNNKSRIKELEQMLEAREIGGHIPHKSHISSSSAKRQTIKSQSSLKYSSNSQLLMSGSHFYGSRKNQEKIIDLDLSEAGSSFFEQPSQFSNVEQIFERQELPYEKMKIKRKEQIKLLEKTSSYIKSLKKAIDEKNKRIKLLEKKIESLKTSQLVRKDLGPQMKEQTSLCQNDFEDTFRDYESVQLDKKKGTYHRRYKQLEDDTKLVMQENQILSQQIQGLEQELLKAQEQQNSLVKIKDLYKQEIKKLIKKNEEQTKTFEEQLKNERLRVQQSQSVHNIEAIKQLFLKIIQVCSLKFGDDSVSSKKKEEKRKELEEYVKVMSNILKLEKKTKEGLLAMIHK